MRFRRFAQLKQSFPGTALLVEIVSIVFAVLLALVVNEWRENRHLAQQVERSVDGLRLEIESNLQKVREAHAYQAQTLELMRSTLYSEEEDAHEPDYEALITQLYEREGGMWCPAQTVDSAWKTAETTGILRHMDYQRVLLLAHVYDSQARYQAEVRGISEAQTLVAFLDTSPARFAGGFYQGVNTVWWQEKSLLDAYEGALQQLSKE